MFLDALRYIPIPNIEGSNAEYDWRFENIIFSGENVIPDHVVMSTYTSFNRPAIDRRAVPVEAQGSDWDFRVHVHADRIHADLKDVRFFYRKKTGLIKLKDEGLVDIQVSGIDGLVLDLFLSPDRDDPRHTFHPDVVNVDIEKMRLDIHESKHDLMYKILGPIIKSKLRKSIESTLRDTLREAAFNLDGKFTELRKKSAASETPLLTENVALAVAEEATGPKIIQEGVPRAARAVEE